MKRLLVFTFLFFFLLSANGFVQQIKKPVVSGTFYPDSAKILAERIKQFLDWAEVKKTDKDILALISAHAGYDYSGSIAAYGYKAIRGKPIRTVVIIGPSHYENFAGISVYPQGLWQTPLGNVPVDTELAQGLIQNNPKISFYEPAFAQEHSLEVQIPFLQIVLDNFKIVPILCGRLVYEDCQALAGALVEAVKDRQDVLLVASTDMSHYHSYDEACRIDQTTIKELTKLDPRSLYNKIASRECELCGAEAVITTLLYAQAKGAKEIEILKYANSGDITADKRRVVGYLSAAIYIEPRGEKMSKENQNNQEMLDERQKGRLLEIARQTINEYVTKKKIMEFTETDPLLLKNMGAFVTLHKGRELRGCIGNIIGQQPLYLTIRDMAIEAATTDPRFAPVKPNELAQIEIEVSVLSEPKKVEDVAQIQMGIHGVIVKKGFANGVFLPQVAIETGWSREEFLTNLCTHKAGLDPLAWKDKNTQLFSFTAQVFGEKENR